MVDPGSSMVSEIVVQGRGEKDVPVLYHVNVTRLSGTETMVKSLQIEDSIFVPRWNPQRRNYTVYLDIKQDIIKVKFQALDNGQVISLVSPPEVPDQHAQKRRLGGDDIGPAIGEVQHTPSVLLTTIDIGNQRTVQLVVTSADQSTVGQYKFKVKRPPCHPYRRFFDGLAKVCTDICNEGYFGNVATGRCSPCLTANCASCSTGATCSMCQEGFELQGSTCVAAGANSGLTAIAKAGDAVENYGEKHRVLMWGFASTLALAVAACCILAYCVWGRRQSKSRLLDDDDEELSNLGYYEESYRG